MKKIFLVAVSVLFLSFGFFINHASAALPWCNDVSEKNTTTNLYGVPVYCDNELRLWTPTAPIWGSDTTYSWDEASAYCNSLNTYGSSGYGHLSSGWSLPSCLSGKNDSNCELYQFAVDADNWTYSCGNTLSCPSPIPMNWTILPDDMANDTSDYWSSTKDGNGNPYAVAHNGRVASDYSGPMYVRCVYTPPPTPPQIWNQLSNYNGTKIFLDFTKAMSDPSAYPTDFVVTVNGSPDVVTAATLHSGDSTTIDLTLTTPIVYGQDIRIAYSGSPDITSSDTGTLANFTNDYVTNSSEVLASVAITGTVKVGSTLTAETTPAATASYQWEESLTSDGAYADISDATSKNYVPVVGDIGYYLKVVADGTGSYFGTVTSNATSTVAITPPTFMSAVSSADGTEVVTTFSKAMSDPSVHYSDFYVVNSVTNSGDAVTAATLHSGDSTKIDLTLTTPLVSGQTYHEYYLGSPDVVSADNGVLADSISSISVTNNVEGGGQSSTCPTINNAATYNAYPTCGAVTCNSGYTLSGGACAAVDNSGGGGNNTPTVSSGGGGGAMLLFQMSQQQNSDVAPNQDLIVQLQNQIASLQNQIATLTGSQNSNSVLPSTNAGFIFTKNLMLGDGGDDVKQLQVFLNTHGFALALNGPGSLGNETTYFSNLTKAAVTKMQEANADKILTPQGFTQGTGMFYSYTRAFVNNILAGN